MNCVQMMGYMTRDPEMRYAANGTAVCTGAVAVNRKWRTDGGELKEEVSYFDWTAFGKTGETISQYLKKGDPFLFEGRLQQQRWDDKQDGRPRSKVVIIVERMTFVPSRKRDGDQSLPATAPTSKQDRLAPPVAAGAAPMDSTDDDVPF